MSIVGKLRLKISVVYYNHGLFCATHPVPVITCVCLIVVILCLPLAQLPFIKDVPLDHIVLREDEFRSFSNSHLLLNYGHTNKSLGYGLQIVLHSTVVVPSSHARCFSAHQPLVDVLLKSAEILRLLRDFRTVEPPPDAAGRSFEDVCYQVEDRVVMDTRDGGTLYNALPTFGCLVLAPSLLWDNDVDRMKTSVTGVFSHLKHAAVGHLRDLLFGLPWQLTGIRHGSLCQPGRNTWTFAVTLVFRDYEPQFIDQLQQHLRSRFPLSTNHAHFGSDSTSDANETHAHSEDPAPDARGSAKQIYLVWYRGRSYLSDYAPLIFIYVVLLLYVYFSVCKLELVKSKWGLAFSACFTVVASLCMSMGLCVSIGLMVPTLNGSEIFPYLVVLIGFENVIILTKSVVATPIDLPVKYRIAEGLSKESWPLTRHYCTELLLLGLGFFTFHPTMQEFCLFAVVGVTTDYFLQLFFFVAVLSIDIRRMELTDLSKQCPNFPILPTPHHFISGLSNHAVPKRANESSRHASPHQPHNPALLSSILCDCMNRIHRALVHVREHLRPYRPTIPRVLVAKIPFRRSHKRSVSAAEAAAFLSSDAKPSENFPRRLWLLRIWAKHRLFQRLFTLAVAVWIVVIVLYTVDFTRAHTKLQWVFATKQPSNSMASSPTPPDQRSSSSKSVVAGSEPGVIDSSDETSATSVQSASVLLGLDRVLRRLDTSAVRQESRGGSFLHSSESTTWDVNVLWKYLAFFQWPLLAKYYNLSLAGCHLTLVEPIHLMQEIHVSLDSQEVLVDDVHSLTKQFPYGVPEVETEKRKYDWNWMPYGSLQDLWIPASRSGSTAQDSSLSDGASDDSVPGSSITTHNNNNNNNNRFFGLYEDLLQFVRTSTPHRPALPGGVAGWTARLWLTVTMLGTSLVSCGCVLLLTCLGMVCFQELQSKSSPPSTREPVIRVLPLTISLNETSAEVAATSEPMSGADWTVTCGTVNMSTDQGTMRVEGVIAACCVPQTLNNPGVPSTNCIRLWCTSSGVALPPINRYSDDAIQVRRKMLTSGQRVLRRRTTVWCMCFSHTGSLLVGCNDGSIEIWNCELARLEGIVCLREARRSCSSAEVSNTNHSSTYHPGGVTVLVVTGLHSFAVGTSRGCVAWFDVRHVTTTQERRCDLCTCQWHAHSRSVAHLTSAPVNSSLCTALKRDPNDAEEDRVILVSGADDGSVSFMDTVSEEILCRVSMDNTVILSFDFSNLMLAISYASGSLFAVPFRLSVDTKIRLETTDDRTIALANTTKTGGAGGGVASSDVTRPRRGNSIGLKWYATPTAVRLQSDGSFAPQTTEFRLVTAELDGLVAIWNVRPVALLRTFRANLSSINPCNPLVSLDNRVVFGDQGYLRVINPWTVKYERSVHLLPPSTAHIQNTDHFTLSHMFNQWSRELIPIGVAGTHPSDPQIVDSNTGAGHCSGNNWAGSVMVSVAEGGEKLVVIPLVTLRTV